ncbi:MAG: tetratricopeptide repeat protein [Lentisphaeria bacterium]|nr:tetratricopeptide repeat protein [Lentisphaeria bacterium]
MKDLAETPRFRKENFLVWSGLIALGVLLRMEYWREFSASPLFDQALGADVGGYFRRAQEIAAGHFQPAQPDIHAPLYSWFLAGLFRLGLGIPAVRAVQLALNFAAWIGGTLFLKGRCGEHPRISWIFLAWGMLYTPSFFYQAELISESILLPLLMLAAGLLELAWERSGKGRLLPALGGGLCCGLAAITHPTALLCPVLIGIWWGCCGLRKWAAVPLAMTVLVVLPVSVLRSMDAGYPVLVQSNSAFNAYLGNSPEADGGCRLRPGRAWRDFHRQSAAAAEEQGIRVDELHLRNMLDFWLHHPGKGLLLAGRKALLALAPAELPAGADTPEILGFTPVVRWGLWLNWLLLISAVIGVFEIRWRKRVPLIVLIGAAFWMSQILTVSSGRYRQPVIPALFVLSAFGMGRMTDPRRKAGAALLGGVLAGGAYAVIPVRPGEAAEGASLLAEAYYRKGNFAASLRCLDRCVTDSPDPARDANLRGCILRNSDPAGAEAAFRKAVQLDEFSAEGWMNLGILAAAGGDFAGAANAFEQALLREPDHAGTLYNYGLLHENCGRSPQAEACYRAVLALDVTHRQAWNALGVLLFRKGDLAGAVRSFSAALALEPENPGLRKNLELAEKLLQSR